MFYVLPCVILLLCFSVLFSIAITSLGKEKANLSAFRTFVRFVLVWICRFSLPVGVWEGLRFVIVALPGLFSYFFIFYESICFMSYVMLFSVLLALRLPRLGKGELIFVLFVLLFDLGWYDFVCPLRLGVREGLRLVIVALPGLFSYPFLGDPVKLAIPRRYFHC